MEGENERGGEERDRHMEKGEKKIEEGRCDCKSYELSCQNDGASGST